MPNVRARGKIPKSEWPSIAARYRDGETLTELARRYQCTPPAIRYIVRRTAPSGGKKAETERTHRPAGSRLTVRPRTLSDHLDRMQSEARMSPDTREIWERVNTDIARFLAAMELLLAGGEEDHYQALLDATDRLLWACARTRLELERVLNRNKSGKVRRLSA